MAFLSSEKLKDMGFRSLGKDVKISDKAVIYGANKISVGDYSRIDDFCVLSAGEGGIEIGSYVHIAVFCSLIGKELISLHDFSGLSSRVAIYSSSDDYSGKFLTNPTVPQRFTNVDNGAVILNKHVIIGVNSTILPGVTIYEGSAIGAYSLVTHDINSNKIATGVPAREIKNRSTDLYELEKRLLNSKS